MKTQSSIPIFPGEDFQQSLGENRFLLYSLASNTESLSPGNALQSLSFRPKIFHKYGTGFQRLFQKFQFQMLVNFKDSYSDQNRALNQQLILYFFKTQGIHWHPLCEINIKMNRGIIEHTRLGAGAFHKREQFLAQLTQESVGGKIQHQMHIQQTQSNPSISPQPMQHHPQITVNGQQQPSPMVQQHANRNAIHNTAPKYFKFIDLYLN